jgi:hypothetical protein
MTDYLFSSPKKKFMVVPDPAPALDPLPELPDEMGEESL